MSNNMTLEREFLNRVNEIKKENRTNIIFKLTNFYIDYEYTKSNILMPIRQAVKQAYNSYMFAKKVGILDDLNMKRFECLSNLEVIYTIKVRLSNGKIAEVNQKVYLENVPCNARQEECHGQHTIFDYDQSFLDKKQEEFAKNLTLDEVNLSYEKELGLTDDIRVIEILKCY